MTWVRLEDTFTDHFKVSALEPTAFMLHVAAMCHCGRNLTDGRVDAEDVPRLVRGYREEWVAELVGLGLWDVVEGGYLVHDFLAYNPTREKVLAQREAAARRKEKWNASRNGVPNGVRNASPSRPDPTRDDSFVVITAPEVSPLPSLPSADDDDDVSKLALVLAQRKLTAQEAAGFAPVARSRWLQTVSAAEMAERGPEALRGALRACDGDAERAADLLLEPPATVLRIVGPPCEECDGLGVVLRDDDLAVDCECKFYGRAYG